MRLSYLWYFLPFVGPIYDPGNLACFIPVFLVVMPLLCIVPMSLLLGLEVLDCAIFAVTTLLCKEHSRIIMECSRTICTIFAHSPVYRVGGDEFVVLLRNSDYEKQG